MSLEDSLQEIDKMSSKIRSKTLRKLCLLYLSSITFMPMTAEKFVDEKTHRFPSIDGIMKQLGVNKRAAYDYQLAMMFLEKAYSLRGQVFSTIMKRFKEEENE